MSTSAPVDVVEDNPFALTTEVIILLAVAVGLLLILIICCCCILKKRREKTIEVTPSAIQEGRVTPSQLLDAGVSPQSVVDMGAATPSQLVNEGLASPNEVDLRKKGPPLPPLHNYHGAGYPPPMAPAPRLATPEELKLAGYTPSQLSTYSIIHRQNEKDKGKKRIVGSDETLKKESSPKRVVIEPSQGTIYNGPIKRTVGEDKTKKTVYEEEEVPESKKGNDDLNNKNNNTNNTFSTWMSPKDTKSSKKRPEPSTVPSNYNQVADKNKKEGRVVVMESNVSRKGSMATDVNVFKDSKVSNVSNVKTQSPSMKTQGKKEKVKMVSKTSSKRNASKKSVSPSSGGKKGKSKYDVDD